MINEVSKKVNLSQKRIREYEKEGFIKPDREPRTNNRLYSDFDIDQIKRINYLIHTKGFTLACLRQLLNMAACWNVFDCKRKEECAAHQNPYEQCWKTREKIETKCTGPCGRCAIYLTRSKFPKKEKILEGMGHGWADGLEADSDRRRHARLAASLPLEFVTGRGKGMAQIENMTLGGLKVKPQTGVRGVAFKPGDTMEIRFDGARLGGRLDVLLEPFQAKVVWANDAGSGLEFVGLDESRRDHMRSFLHKLLSGR
ncbi:MAG: MerR family transcriptional regulator [Pseudomonadota bacterium]